MTRTAAAREPKVTAPDWNDLAVILAICRAGSLSGAARMLGQTHSTVFRKINAIEEKTGGKAVILPGTLYATMNRMLDDGLIAEVPRPEGADARRKYYRITERGRSVVAAEMERMAVLMDVARRDLLADG